MEVVGLQSLNWNNRRFSNQLLLIWDTSQSLQCIHKAGRCCAHEIIGTTSYYTTIWKLNCNSWAIGLRCLSVCITCNQTLLRLTTGLTEKEFLLHQLALSRSATLHSNSCLIVAADDFLLRCFSACLVIRDSEAYHIYTHVCRGLVWALTHDTLQNRLEHWEHLYITVIVHSCLTICFEVEWIDHIHIIQIHSSCLIGQIDRVREWQIPNWEGLELRIASLQSTLILMVEL